MGKKKRSKRGAAAKGKAIMYAPDPERLAELRSRIKPLAKLRVYAAYLYLLILLLLDIVIFSAYGGGKSLTAMLYFLLGTIFIFIGSFQRYGAAGTIVKAAKEDADTLFMTGPYGKSRHPLYFGSFMNGIGFAFLAGPFGDILPGTRDNFIGLIPWGLVPFAIILIPIYIRMIRVEDEFLAERFGPVFDKYCQGVPCFFPSFTLFTRDKDWKLDPGRLKENREVRNFVGLMIVYALLFAKLLYYMIIQLHNVQA